MSINISDIQNSPEKSKGSNNSVFDFLNKDISLGSSFNQKSKEQFYSGLSTLLESGIDLNRSLIILSSEFKSKKSKAILEVLIQKIQSGLTLSDAMNTYSKSVFSKYEIASIKVGEEVGKLVLVIKELQKFYRNSIKRKRMLTSALSYPVLVSTIALFAVFFMMTFVVPMFEDIFKRFNGELPYITELVISVSRVIEEQILVIVCCLVVIIFGAKLLLRIEVVNTLFSKLVLSIPFIGGFLQKIYLSKLAGAMSMMLGSGIHLLKALELSKSVVGFNLYEVELEKSVKSLQQGGTLHEAFSNKMLFPNKFTSLIKVGEEVSKLDFFLDKANEEFNEELEYTTSLLGTVLEPILLVFLGGAIGIILVSMYLPLFDLSGQW